MRKPTMWFFDQVRHNPSCKATEARILKFWECVQRRKCSIHVAKTKAPISFAVTAKLICVFVFANADCRFSHEAAQMHSISSVDQLAKLHSDTLRDLAPLEV